MRYAVLVAAICMVVGAVGATVPDQNLCTVTPCDTYGGVIICPSTIPDGQFTVNVRNANNDPIPNAYVELVFGTPGNHWLCNDAVLTGSSDALGNVTFNISGGGCTMGADALRIIANTYPIRSFSWVKSPDFAGGAGSNGYVDLPDFSYFATAYGLSTYPCTDYKGTGATDLDDFSLFAGSYGKKCPELP